MGLSNVFFSHDLTPSLLHYFFSCSTRKGSYYSACAPNALTSNRYYFAAMLSADISPMKVTCTAQEFVRFRGPDGQTCLECTCSLQMPS
jgi:hypothetical protein